MEEINKLAEEMRVSLSDFCINECHAFCCRDGFLPLSSEDVEVLGVNDLTRLKEKLNGKYFLNLRGGCPALGVDFKCSIHKDPRRPSTCKDFPVFVQGKQVKISHRCLAYGEGKFFLFERQVVDAGGEVVESFV